MKNITLDDFKYSYNKIKIFVKNTDLIKINKNTYIKKESQQITGSFKWSGVLYATMRVFDQILEKPIKSEIYYIVTQSTGNHGIALIRSVNILVDYYLKKFPEYKQVWLNIAPCVFTNKNIKLNKLNIMKKELIDFKYNKYGFINDSFYSYSHSLIARTEFLKKKNGIYIEHGGRDIMTGYGYIAFEIDRQLPKNKKIILYVSIGAGGPVGIGLCLSFLREIELVVCQTTKFDAYIKTLNTNIIHENSSFSKIIVSDGIAVDKPEICSIELIKNINYHTSVVSVNDVLEVKKKINLGNSTCIAYASYLKNKNISDNICVILDCEGNL
jgi:threonine dehydratase